VSVDYQSQVLLSQSVKHTKALQQLAREKEALHEALTEASEELRASQTARKTAEARVLALEHALRGVTQSAAAALGPA